MIAGEEELHVAGVEPIEAARDDHPSGLSRCRRKGIVREATKGSGRNRSVPDAAPGAFVPDGWVVLRRIQDHKGGALPSDGAGNSVRRLDDTDAVHVSQVLSQNERSR
jgi:hypothetical protein